MNTRVLIVGGGIGGLAAACALRQAGIATTVLERAPGLRPIGGGLLLSSNASRVLAALGCLDRLRALSSSARVWRLLDEQGSRLSEVVHRDDPGPISLLRSVLQETLIEMLPPETVKFGAEVQTVETNQKGARVVLRDGTEWTAALVIGADGIHSVVREKIFSSSPPRYSGYVGWRGVAEMDVYHDDALSESWGIGKRFGVAAAGPGLTYWYASDNRPDNRLSGAANLQEELRELFVGWHAPVSDLIARTKSDRIHFDAIYELPIPRNLNSGPFVLLGDAAHAMTPNLGQGACLAIEDAWVLAATVARQGISREALAVYSALRRPRALSVQRSSRIMGWVIQRPGRLLAKVRNMTVRVAPRAGARHFFKHLTGFVPETLPPVAG